MKIAVIGSGLAGLSACWYASDFARVALLEKEASVGIDAHSVDVALQNGDVVRIDTPLRVMKAGYYPGLLRLYAASRIPTEIIDYSGSFSDERGRPYFRYRNLILGDESYSFLSDAFSFARQGRRILRDILRFYMRGAAHLSTPAVADMSFGEYLEAYEYSDEFRERFILPLFAAVNTCSYDAVKAYPAATLIGYLVNSRKPGGVRRIVGGVAEVAKNLAQAADEIRCGFAVREIHQDGDQVRVTTEHGPEIYDYVVLATQANQAARFCEPHLPRHRQLLSRFRYEKSELIVHKDPSFLPAKRGAWSPVNFTVDAAYEKPMATIYMNAIQNELRAAEPILQTWNPHRSPAQADLIAQAQFERPLVDGETVAILQDLAALNRDAANRVKICGSYTESGIPLLEAAAVSGERIAGLIAAENN